jgi:threonine dehydratase
MPRSNYLSERCKGEIFLKFENMQRTGSFKIRGAFNKLSSLTDAEKRKGVVACSAGTTRRASRSPAPCSASTAKW